MSATAIRCLGDAHGSNYSAYHGDCVDVMAQLPTGCVDFSVYSPPFSGIYLYSESVADMANCASDSEFIEHYNWVSRELYRVTAPGRLAAVHCKDLVFYATQRGTAGLRDFPGMLIRSHEAAGWNFHSRVTIWRCPVREMTKTKAQGLLYKQLRKDSSFSRQGLAEYLLLFRKWAAEGDEVKPIVHSYDDFPLEQWQQWASPVWPDTRETDVLEARQARDERDEKHICPMPLDLIGRAITLWSNPGDTVLSPFMGIGSEGYESLLLRRRFIGIELKESYFREAVKTLVSVDSQNRLLA